MKRRLLPMFIAAILAFQCCIPVLAVDMGTFVYTMDTEVENIKESPDGKYAMVIPATTRSTTQYLPVGRLDIDPSDQQEVSNLQSNPYITQAAKAVISQKLEVINNPEAKISVFSPELLRTDDRTEIKYHTYNGHEMMSEIIYTSGASVPYKTVESGTTVRNLAANLTNVAISVLGFANLTPITILSTGVAILTLMTDTGSLTSASASDYLQLMLVYNDQVQMTHTKMADGTWALGLTSSAVQVTRIGTCQYYRYYSGSAPNPCTKERYINEIRKSPHYDNPWATAYQYQLQPEEELLRWRVGSTTYLF